MMLNDDRCHDVYECGGGYYLLRLLLDFLCGGLQRLSQVTHAPLNHLPKFGVITTSLPTFLSCCIYQYFVLTTL